jgi:hypothetical protein
VHVQDTVDGNILFQHYAEAKIPVFCVQIFALSARYILTPPKIFVTWSRRLRFENIHWKSDRVSFAHRFIASGRISPTMPLPGNMPRQMLFV